LLRRFAGRRTVSRVARRRGALNAGDAGAATPSSGTSRGRTEAGVSQIHAALNRARGQAEPGYLQGRAGAGPHRAASAESELPPDSSNVRCMGPFGVAVAGGLSTPSVEVTDARHVQFTKVNPKQPLSSEPSYAPIASSSVPGASVR